MTLALIMPGRDANEWKTTINRWDPSIRVEIYPEIHNHEEIIGAVLWNHPLGILKNFPDLKWVSSIGAGIEHILNDPDLPPHITITRLVDKNLVNDMVRMVLLSILNYEKEFYRYYQNKEKKTWEPNFNQPGLHIGMMGLGELGLKSARVLSDLGYRVSGISKGKKNIEGIACYSDKEWGNFLKEPDVLVCLLPLTTQTENLMDSDFFDQVKPGVYLVNLGRGKQLVEKDLIDAINKGTVSGAFLDVFREEPLPENHPFWEHDKIMITPHIASITNIESGSKVIVENYQSVLKGKPLRYQIDPRKGY